jgi:hypothetical protein
MTRLTVLAGGETFAVSMMGGKVSMTDSAAA